MSDPRNTSKGSSEPHGSSALSRLTPRQREIIELVARGLTNDEVATVLGISSATVRTHLTTIMAKLEVTNRTEATARVHSEDRTLAMETILSRPMIAVLPFEVIHGDARTQSFGLGLAYDLSSLFARSCWFPVVSTASTAGARAFGGCREIGQRLGSRFLVDGSIRMSDAFVLNVRIDDTEQGTCLWTGRFSCRPDAFFETQDAICEEIVATVYPMLIARANATDRSGRAHDLAAWELAHEGMRMQAMRAENANQRARAQLLAARDREPELALAHFGLGLVSYDAVLNQWAPEQIARRELLSSAEATIALAPHGAEGFYLLARHHQTRGEVSEARDALLQAVSRNPSFATAHALLAQVLQLSGASSAALDAMRVARRLSPQSFVAGLAALHFIRREYELASETAERCVQTTAGYPFAYMVAAASAHYIGDAARARGHIATLRATHPSFDEASFLTSFGADVDALERLVRAMKAIEH